MNTTMIPIAEIRINPDRRKLDKQAVKRLAESIAEVGLLNPIAVDTENTLIAGLHRLEAVRSLGQDTIACTVRDFKGLQAKLAEIDENFVRSPLSEIERCDILLRRKKIYEALHPETTHGGDRKSEKIKTARRGLGSETPKSFVRDTAEKLGISPSAVERRVRIAERVAPEAKKVFEEAEEKFNQKEALNLTHVAPEHQVEAARQYVAGDIRSIGDYQPDETNPAPAKKQRTNRRQTARAAPPETGKEDTDSPTLSPAQSAESQTASSLPRVPNAESRKPLTFKEIVADLKDVNKERPLTPDMFVSEFDSVIDDLIRHIEWFDMQEYLDVFPALTEEQYLSLRSKQEYANTRIDTFLELVKGKMKP